MFTFFFHAVLQRLKKNELRLGPYVSVRRHSGDFCTDNTNIVFGALYMANLQVVPSSALNARMKSFVLEIYLNIFSSVI